VVLNVCYRKSSTTVIATVADSVQLELETWNAYYLGNSLWSIQQLGVFVHGAKLPLLF
jgi:hypothetical protein